MVEEFRARRDLIVDGLNAIPGFRCLRPQGAFYVFPDISATGLDGAELADRLLHEAGVCVLAGRRSAASGTTTSGSRTRTRRRTCARRWAGSGRSSTLARGRRRRVGACPMRARGSSSRALIPDEGLRRDPRGLRRRGLAGRAAAAAGRAPRGRSRGCDGVLTLLTDRVDDEFLDAAGPQLKVVCELRRRLRQHRRAGAARARGIPVGNTPGVLTETTADLAWALLMAAARRLPEGDRYVRAGKWKTWGPLLLLGPDVHGATIGIVGFGRIGQAMARRARGFGMTDPLPRRPARRRRRSRPSSARRSCRSRSCCRASDFVSLHVNLTAETQRPDRRREALVDEADRGPGQHVARAGRRHGAALADALRDGHDLRRRAST